MPLTPTHPLVDGRTSDAPLVRAYRGQRPERTPVWFMRQAGRSLPEYRALRAGGDMLEACLTPTMASEITLQPVRRHGVDAAIFFSDIVVPVLLAGVDVRIVAGRGPVLDSPVRTASDVLKLRPLDPAVLDPVREAVELTVAELGHTPLIGFAGAPFTLAAYLVEGGPSKDQIRARTLMRSDPQTWASLLNWCADITGQFLRAQIEAGASAAQLFDSWVGSLSRDDYRRRVAPHSKRALDHLRSCPTSQHSGSTRSASTGAYRSTTPQQSSATMSACRATSTLHCWAHRGPRCGPTSMTCWSAVALPAPTSSTSATAFPPRPTPTS